MNIRYLEPLEAAWGRMVGILFRPFDLSKWLVIGFSAWLATLADGGVYFPTGVGDLSTAADAGREASRDLEVSGCIIAAIVAAAVLLLALVVVILWLESRGELVFLDNVVHGRALIAAPWRGFAPEGHSLFLWRLGFVAAVLAVLAVIVAPFIAVAVGTRNADEPGPLFVGLLLVTLLVVIAVALVAVFVDFLLEGFVVPLMYRDRLRASEAWRRFLPLLGANLGPFLLCGLILLGLHLALGAAVVIAIVVTCCIAAIPLVVPYIGTVVLLPAFVLFRLYTLEFLGQLGPDWRVLPDPVPAPPPAVPPAPPAQSPPPIQPPSPPNT